MTKVVASFNDRLNEALEKRDIRAVDLAKRIDISEATMSQYRSGYAKPKYDRIVRIADALDVNLTWLMGGDVPMEKNRGPVEIKYLDPSGFFGTQLEVTKRDHSDMAKMMALYQAYQQALPQIREAVDSLLKPDKPDA